MAALLLLACARMASGADALSDFTTDGCSLFPNGSPVSPDLWCDCCVKHDMAYWRGGTEEERTRADEALRSCVEQRTGNKPFSELVYAGVRAGGLPIYPTWYRWGYGWKYGRGYQAVTEQESAEAQQKLDTWLQAHPELTCRRTPGEPTEMPVQTPGE